MRKRSKSVFVGAEVQHYLESKNFGDEEDEKKEEVTKRSATKFENGSSDAESEDFNTSESEGDNEEKADNSVLHLIQQVHAQIPANDKLPFDERLNMIDWSVIQCDYAKKKILDVIESERKHRLLHEILDDAHKKSIKNLDIKRPTSYIGLYIAENREALRTIMNNIGSKNIITTANSEFKKLSEKDKQNFIERANSAKGSYNNEMKKYTLNFRKGGGSSKEKKITPFTLYQDHEHLTGVVLPRSELSKKYNDLPHDEKIIWILRYLGVNRGDKVSFHYITKVFLFVLDILRLRLSIHLF